MNKINKTRTLVEGGIMIALGLILSLIKPFELPYGGSVTLQTLPLIIYSIRWGIKKGLFVGFVFGLLSIFLGGYVVHPIQALLDYPIAFMFIGIAGLYGEKNKTDITLVFSILFAFILKLISHVVSGFIFFKDTVPANENMVKYMFAYNASFTIPEAILVIIVIFILTKIAKDKLFTI